MKFRNIVNTGVSALLAYIASMFFYFLKKNIYYFNKLYALVFKIKLKHKGRISFHYKTSLILKNSTITVENGLFKVGTDFGYFDGGIANSTTDRCQIHLLNTPLKIEGDVSLFPGVKILGVNGDITIKGGTKINPGTKIISIRKIEIGRNCMLAADISIRDNDGHKLGSVGEELNFATEDVIIKDNVWIGQAVIILKGVTIGENSVIASGAVVTKSIPANSIAAGVPAKVIRDNVKWEA